MLGLEGNDLIVGLFSNLRNSLNVFILIFGISPKGLRLFIKPLAFILGGSQLFSQDINFSLEISVFRFSRVEAETFIFNGSILRLNFNLSLQFL